MHVNLIFKMKITFTLQNFQFLQSKFKKKNLNKYACLSKKPLDPATNPK